MIYFLSKYIAFVFQNLFYRLKFNHVGVAGIVGSFDFLGFYHETIHISTPFQLFVVSDQLPQAILLVVVMRTNVAGTVEAGRYTFNVASSLFKGGKDSLYKFFSLIDWAH